MKRDAVKVSAFTHIEVLTLDSFIQLAQIKPNLFIYLPNERDRLHIDRDWVCDLLYTMDKEAILKTINDALK